MYSEHYWIDYTSERMGSFHTAVGVELRLWGEWIISEKHEEPLDTRSFL